MKYISYDNHGAFRLFFVRLSEAELETIEACFDWIITNSNVVRPFEDCTGGATVEELEQMRDTVRLTMLNHFRNCDLPEKASRWSLEELRKCAEEI